MDDIANKSLLFDFYGDLLTDKKKEIMELYINDDMSISEIAEEIGVSRAAVFDSLKIATEKLGYYEDTLGLVKRYTNSLTLLSKAESILDKVTISNNDRNDLRRVINELAGQDHEEK